MNCVSLDAVVLAGGRGSRLGGVDKATLMLGDERLVDRAVGAARAAGAERIVVVGPDHVGGDEVTVVREEPQFGGPLAALTAALPLLRAEWVLLLSCDLVWPYRVCEILVGQHNDVSADGLALRDSDGYPQWLAGMYRVDALRSAARPLGDDVDNAPLRRLLGSLDLLWIDAPPEVTSDIDNPDDLERARTLNTRRRTP